MRLKSDVLVGTNDGLMSEKAHLTNELKECKHLYHTYEQKCNDLMKELHQTTTEYQALKRSMLGYDEETKHREEKLENQRELLEEARSENESLSLQLGTLKIQYEKI